MFKARFKKYWCDYVSQYETFCASSIEEILEHAYRVHKDSAYPHASRFFCRGDRDNRGGYLEANCSLEEKCGYRGSLWLESITYCKGDGSNEVIIFSKNDHYISPKASKAFDNFAAIAEQRSNSKNFGDF